MRKRLFNISLALGLTLSLVLGALGTTGVSAATPKDADVEWLFYPWVPNGEMMGDTGPWFGSVTIQNLENDRINIAFSSTAGNSVDFVTTLEAHASKTFSAANLGLPDNGGSLAVRASWYFDVSGPVIPGVCENSQRVVQETIKRGESDSDPVATENAYGVENDEITVGTTTYTMGEDFVYTNGEITWVGNAPAEGTSYKVNFLVADCIAAPQIAGSEKQVSPGSDGFLSDTADEMLSVDGYSAIPDEDTAWGSASSFCHDVAGGDCANLGAFYLGQPIGLFGDGGVVDFDGHSYLPITQANWSGWDTYIHLANIDPSSNSFASVDVRFYRAGQGLGDQAVAAWQGNVAMGEAQTIDVTDFLASRGIDNFVGSAWITSDYGVVANASRVKASDNMALTNTSAPSLFATTSLDNLGPSSGNYSPYPAGQFQMYAPLVYKDYNGWNTGINIANVSEVLNQVTVQIFNRDGTSIGSYTVSLPAHGMEYVYIPTSQELGLGNGDFGAAILTGQAPFHAAVDEVKYSTGEAMSYIATAADVVSPDLLGRDSRVRGSMLGLPLFQKGNGSHGDNSGINLFNSASGSVTGTVDFYTPSGSLETPSTIGSVPFTVGPHGSTYVYAPNMGEMTNNIRLSAVVNVTGGLGSLSAVSNQVNYDVQADGGVVYNMFNPNGQFRFVCSQSDCGFALLDGDGDPVIVTPGGGDNQAPGAIGNDLDLSCPEVVAVGAQVNCVATVEDGPFWDRIPLKNGTVSFNVFGPISTTPDEGSGVTGEEGTAGFPFSATDPGTVLVVACTDDVAGGIFRRCDIERVSFVQVTLGPAVQSLSFADTHDADLVLRVSGWDGSPFDLDDNVAFATGSVSEGQPITVDPFETCGNDMCADVNFINNDSQVGADTLNGSVEFDVSGRDVTINAQAPAVVNWTP